MPFIEEKQSRFKELPAEELNLDKPKKEKSFGEKAFEFVEPAAEALGTVGGAALGTPLGPLGTVGGAGLGYAMTREGLRLGKEKLGYVEPRNLGESFKEPAKDILYGGSMEAGGRGVIAPVIQKTIGAASRGLGTLGDYLTGSNFSKLTAGKMARQAVGSDLNKAREILASSADDISASQALGEIDKATGKPVLNSPTIQALLASAEKKDPRFFTNLLGEQDGNRLSQLRKIANGTDQTAAKDARAGLKELLNKRLIPTLENELKNANIGIFSGTEKAINVSPNKQLTIQNIQVSLNKKLNDPSIAGNKELETGIKRVLRDLTKWADPDTGIIASEALDSIRKNSVNAVARELFKDDIKAQKKFAGQVLATVNPLIVDLIQNSGGTGYGTYLNSYAIGSQKIAQTKMGADALELYTNSPTKFVQLVENNKIDDVEKVFGVGNYNLAKQMSAEAMDRLKRVSGEIKRGENIKEQVTAGNQAFSDLANENKSKFRLPSFLSAKVTISNKILDALEGKLNKNVMNELVKASKSGKNLEQLLDSLPLVQRNEILNRLNDPATFAPARKLVSGTIAGIDNDESISSGRKLGNPLQTKELGGITNIEPNLYGP